MILEQKLRNDGQIFSEDLFLFFGDHHEIFGTKVEKSWTNF